MRLPRHSGHRVLIYSHDTFGLGHLRRCRTIAHSLVKHRDDISVLILSGSPIVGSFDFRSRVDFVRIPGVIKLSNGEYTSLNLDMEFEEVLAMRASIIRHTAEVFDPDLFLVDKEPLGLRGEVEATLAMLSATGARRVLGLRDVMDDPDSLKQEWDRKGCVPALENLYDDIWVYGLSQICNPLEGIDLNQSVLDKITYTGYLPRTATPRPTVEHGEVTPDGPYHLVTTGGGGDGAELVDWVLKAYEYDSTIPLPSVMVLGPFMPPEQQSAFVARANALEKVTTITFDANLELLMANACGVISMGGYNTFCEILSFDKPAVIVPRVKPRREQLVRVSRAQDLGLVRMLVADDGLDPVPMAAALHGLSTQNPPSQVVVPRLLDGLKVVNGVVDDWLPYRPKNFPTSRAN